MPARRLARPWPWPLVAAGCGCAAGRRRHPDGGRDQSEALAGSLPPALDGRRRFTTERLRGHRAGDLSAAVRGDKALVYVPNTHVQHRHGDQPADAEGDRHRSGRRAAPARDPVLGPQDALRRQRRRQQPHADRPADRTVRAPDPGRGPLQPVLHARRARTRSWSPSACCGWTSATRTRCADPLAARCPMCSGVDHMDFSPTAATCSPAASSTAA